MSERLNEDQPIFQQIAELIETNIAEGEMKANDKIPSTNEFAKHYQINPATAAKGINLLVDQEIIYKKRGVGMFVTENAKNIILKKRKSHFFDQYVKPMLKEAERIGINKDQLISWIGENK
ncbi:DNA-binding transcriptional regulator YhcF, GntR family [Gracilibacillus ureilyticus]|uniref:DNA-binding transcriptional regulator YhcF, GntR family n=1 Tax=Gracilibacillus ureilyticus TaxID=531814 RepID=A0A1H9PKU6_9BACI|nr:GntR family transcriptional regulator [Gracilibacillus ureilyticus]SER48455.1 DNA-binding transcriptional regulator YhcF, GntR family [Gracilibacillus ureilyticus]